MPIRQKIRASALTIQNGLRSSINAGIGYHAHAKLLAHYSGAAVAITSMGHRGGLKCPLGVAKAHRIVFTIEVPPSLQ